MVHDTRYWYIFVAILFALLFILLMAPLNTRLDRRLYAKLGHDVPYRTMLRVNLMEPFMGFVGIGAAILTWRIFGFIQEALGII